MRDHLERPFHRGILPSASVVCSRRNPACGDEVTLSLNIKDDTIVEAWHQVRGCLLCAASASILCEHLQGLSMDQAKAISDDHAIEWTGINISPGRRQCCALPVWTLIEAINLRNTSIVVAEVKL